MHAFRVGTNLFTTLIYLWFSIVINTTPPGMQTFLSLPSLPVMCSIRVDDAQLFELGSRAKKNPTKAGTLCKVDIKSKKGSEKWCVLQHNLLFYYESEASTKPAGVIFLEGCLCYPAVVEVSDCPPRYERENCLSIGYKQDGINRHYVFMSKTLEEKNEWISVINNSSMSKLQYDLQALKIRCHQLECKLTSAGTEVQHLKQQQDDAQGNIASLKATLTSPSLKRRQSTLPFLLNSTVSSEEETSDVQDKHARILQTHIRGWLIRRRWKRVVHSYINSPHAEMMKKRNQLIWKLVASEEDYVSQLTVLRGEFQQQLTIAACSLKPYLTLEQCIDIFRNCDELCLFHQLYLRALHRSVEKWPVVNLGEVFKLFTPMLAVYHQYVGNHRYSLDVLFELKLHPQFRDFLETLEKRPACKEMSLEDLLTTPLNRISVYIQDIEELRAHTPTEHVDYQPMTDAISELELIQKTVTDEVSFSENIRQVLSVERKIEGGCKVLLDKEQSLIRKGFLLLCRGDEKGLRKARRQSAYCFLFSKHFLVTQRLEKKKEEVYRIQKDIGILQLATCKVKEHRKPENPDLRFLGIILEYENGVSKQEFYFMALGVSEKAQWMADIAQCIENEKENVILESQSKGEMVELSSNFIRYSTFRAGKEQLVNSGDMKNLLERLVRVSYMGLDFLNTFLTTFPLFTTSTVVMEFLVKSYDETVENRARKASANIVSPEEQVREARALTVAQPIPNRATLSRRSPVRSTLLQTVDNSREGLTSVIGIFFALKHWICKHFYHFEESPELDEKLQKLLEAASQNAVLSNSEKRVVLELSSLYQMQKKGELNPPCPIISFMENKDLVVATPEPPHPFGFVLLWEPRVLAEQLCLIDSVLFCRIDNDELLRYVSCSGERRERAAPNVVRIIQHFNRMSLYWMWAVVKQPTDSNRAKVLELLIQIATECLQRSNFMSMMQIIGALEHSCVLRFQHAWDELSKMAKVNHRALKKVSSTDGRYKQLREEVKKATPPVVPYIAITLTELVSIKQAMPQNVEGSHINFTKMRRFTKIISSILQYQKDPYEFPLVTEIMKLLLCTPLPGDQETLYEYVDEISGDQTHRESEID